MLPLPGFSVPLPPGFEFLLLPEATFGVNLAAWVVLAVVVNYGALRAVRFVIRRLPGEWEDILFGILRGPLLVLLLLFGAVSSSQLLLLTAESRETIRLLSLSILIITLTHITGRVIKDLVVYYGEKWALKTESRIDDILIPVLNLFSPTLLVIGAALLILPLWGVNITSVLVGAGVIGLVLGLALQDPLSNIFSGLSLLVEAPFRTGDLITLPDGRICEVQRIGIRSTQLYSVSEHSIVYVPNRSLAATILTNITKPTVDQRYMLELVIKEKIDLSWIQEKLLRLVKAHPAVLVSNMDEKIPLLREQVKLTRMTAQALLPESPQRATLELEAERNEGVIPRLELEGKLNRQLDGLFQALRELIRGIKAREAGGLSEAERQEIYCRFVAPVDEAITTVSGLASQWIETADPWLDHADWWALRRMWRLRNEQLASQWSRLKKMVLTPDDRIDLRLDDLVSRFMDWLQNEYKTAPAYWKNPSVTVKQLQGLQVVIQLWFYVDNIRLEHYHRAERVRTEIARQVLDMFKLLP